MSTPHQPAAKKPLAVKYPFVTGSGQDYRDLDSLLNDLAAQSGGYYLLGANNYWHGGIHITGEKFAQHKKDHPVRCMMDGVVIAYRLNRQYPIQKWQPTGNLPAKDLKFSNGFCLVKHDYESPANQQDGEHNGKTNKLTFYSLYMHLADYSTYAADTAQSVKTITITKDTNARDAAAIANVIGTLKQGSTVQIDLQQSPKQATVRGRRYHFYLVTVHMPAANSAPAVTTGMQIYLYSGCFPADTFTAVESPKLPGYWKATVTGKSKQPMWIYDSKAHCMQQNVPPVTVLNPEQPCTFQTEKIIKNVAIKGKSHSIAKCEFPASATFRGDPISSGWMIADESQVTWEKVEPTEFDSIVRFTEPMPIAAGDPIGLMGIWESPEPPFMTATTKIRHQMHVELFTTDDKAALEAFLSNSTGLTTGKKYLKVPKGSKLYSSDGHGNFVNPDPLLNAARDYVFEESTCRQVKDSAGTVFYHLKGIKIGEAATGPIDFAHVKLEGNVKLVTQHDWQELGFTTIEETNDNSDGYVDPDKIASPLFQNIFKRVDGINSRNGQGNGVLTGTEIRNALQQDKELRSDLYKMIAGHPSEWHQATQKNLKTHVDKLNAENPEEYKNANQFETDRFLQCEFISQIEGLTQKLWHFHPILSVDNINVCGNKNLRCRVCNKEITITSDFMERIAPGVTVDFYQIFSSKVNELFNKYKIDTCHQVTHILAQAKIETKRFRSFQESLNYTRASYTAEKLYRLSPTIIDNGFERKGLGFYTRAQKIQYIDNNLIQNDAAYAEHCYGNNRYPNRDYRGRGLLHLTHFQGYSDFKDHSGVDVLDNPRLLVTDMHIAIQSGTWFWEKNNIGSLAIDGSLNVVKNITRMINPALHQLKERQQAKVDITEIFNEIYEGCN